MLNGLVLSGSPGHAFLHARQADSVFLENESKTHTSVLRSSPRPWEIADKLSAAERKKRANLKTVNVGT